jgi:hypothetical protein
MRYYPGDIVELFKGHRMGHRYRVKQHQGERVFFEHESEGMSVDTASIFLYHRPWKNHFKALLNLKP